jgi:hypothetical protein
METEKDYEILETNLQPFFGRKIENIIQQNKKAVLQEFLVGLQNPISYITSQNDLPDQGENLLKLILSKKKAWH